MRFSLFSIILLTFWIALGTQAYIGRQRLAELQAEEKRAQAHIKDLQREIRGWQSQDLETKIAESKQELGHLEKIDKALVASFKEEADALSELKPDPEAVSIRTMPAMDLSRQTYHSVKVSIPETRQVGLQLYMREKNAPQTDDEVSSTPPSLGGWDVQGECPVVKELETGIHLIECLYDYRDTTVNPYFVLKVDDKEVTRLVLPNDHSGYSSSRSNWLKQQDIAADRLPELMKLTPSGLEVEIVVRLIEGES